MNTGTLVLQAYNRAWIKERERDVLNKDICIVYSNTYETSTDKKN